MKRLIIPCDDRKKLKALTAGEHVLLSGELYTARDQAHKRLAEAIIKKQPLGLVLKGSALYYCGPCRKQGAVISAGPTTSMRMDRFTPLLLSKGVSIVIGKGRRSEEVRASFKKYGAVYLVSFGGAGALLAECIKECSVVAYPELGPEAVYRFRVEDFPAIVGIDAKGKSIYGS